MNQVAKGRKQRLIEFMGGKCAKCGYDRCVNALQFHRLMGEGIKISSNLTKYSEATLLNEAKMCVLLCSNCRYELLSGQFYIQGIDPRTPPSQRILRFIMDAEVIEVRQIPDRIIPTPERIVDV